MTEEQVIAIYCFCTDFLTSIEYQEWPNVKITLSEIMLIYIIATRFFYDNIERARITLYGSKYIKRGLIKSQLNRRLHGISNERWHKLIGYAYQQRAVIGLSKEFVIDSFPVSVCRNIRINRYRIHWSEEFRGYNASKKEYFYGLKVNRGTTNRSTLKSWMLP